MWDDQFHELAGAYQVIRFDLRGFGRSDMPPGLFCNYEDVRGLLGFLGVGQTHLLGISFGGRVALDFALAYPEYVKALLLGAPSVSGEEASPRIRQFWDEEEAALEKGDLDGATELNLRLWVDGPSRTPDQVAPSVRERVRVMQLGIFGKPMPEDVDEKPLTPPAIERLSEIQVPTCIIVGGLDLEEKIALADRLVAEIPEARKAVIPDAAHMMNMENPKEFNQMVMGFLRSLA
jgi:pimeloyl-ACP methyl ester carboxylesterase